MYILHLELKTRIPSGIWSRLYGSFPSALNTYHASSQQCARGALSPHVVKSLTLNPYMSLWLNLKLCTHIWWTNINFKPPYMEFLVRLGLNFHPGWFAGGRFGRRQFFVTDRQKRDYWSVREARLKTLQYLHNRLAEFDEILLSDAILVFGPEQMFKN